MLHSRLLLNLGMIALLAVLLLLVFYEPGKQPPAQAVRLTDINPGEVQQLIIQSPTRPQLVLEKNGAQWLLQEPFRARANGLRVDSLLAITQASSHTHYPVQDLDLAQLGLTEPGYAIRVNELWLRFGSTDALSQQRYVLVNDNVHLITDRFQHLLQGDVMGFVDPQLFATDTDILSLQLPGLHMLKIDGSWRLENGQATVSADRLQTLIDNWRHARAARLTRQQGEPAGETIRVTTKQQEMTFFVNQAGDEVIVSQPATGLRYHFPQSAGEALLTLPPASSQDTDNPNNE